MDIEKKLTAQSQRVNKQLHVIGLVIGIALFTAFVCFTCGVAYMIYKIYNDILYKTMGYDTMRDINSLVSWAILAVITALASLIFFGLYRAKTPFSKANTDRIRIISILLVLLSVAPIGFELLVASSNNIYIEISINFMYIFIGIILFCLSFIFEHGRIIQQKTDEIINVQEQVILAFAEITEAKSGQTGQHVKRVSEYCRILAEGLGLSNIQVENLRLASMMHDVGKLLIPNEILEKESSLTKEEFEIMKKHVTIGEQLLHNATGEIMEEARTVALEHHEQWNGGGYLGKKGEEISLSARIVAVADVFDALVSARSYKNGWEPNKVYSMIVDEKGKKFDPKVVDVFVSHYSKLLEVYNKFSQAGKIPAVVVPTVTLPKNSKQDIEADEQNEVANNNAASIELDLRHLI